MKVLFLSTRDVNNRANGGELCTNRNYLSFCELIGKENVTAINLMEGLKTGISNAVSKRVNFLSGFNEGLSPAVLKEILEKSLQHDIVFIDSSIHGSLASHLKRNNFKGKIICFFHNVEYKIKLQKAKVQPWKLTEIFVTYLNEKKACRFSDQIIAVNQRDTSELERIYKAQNVEIIPISLADSFRQQPDGLTSVPPTFIFTGNNWYANIQGLDWFVQNVLDHVNIRLQITGFKMDNLKKKYAHPRIDFLGFVDDLPSVLMQADYVVSPIFTGSGMKVKTCEALMYGKNIIGTSESFEGYDMDTDKAGALCNTKDEFVEAINRLCSVKREKFNSYSRSRFLDSYSFNATLGKFKELLG